MLNKTTFSITGLLYFLAGNVYFYFGSSLPLEFTWHWLRVVVALSFTASPLLLGLIIGRWIPEKQQSSPLLGCVVPLFLFLILVHHLIWTYIVLWRFGGYEDQKVTYPDGHRSKHKIIAQYKEEGALGDHERIIEVYELLPFLRYIYAVEYRN